MIWQKTCIDRLTDYVSELAEKGACLVKSAHPTTHKDFISLGMQCFF